MGNIKFATLVQRSPPPPPTFFLTPLFFSRKIKPYSVWLFNLLSNTQKYMDKFRF